ncbi:hypothetical protein Goshw_024803 [Gossypium schwendimanii]|uniref:Uncharacterized protein n=1 Tax=Gossypium schwendimanii TaxID=34291 RepID=A0A7J9MPY5_GOSSC|nr:hypothetical protein [Gossypium schwendimanii]
MQVIRSSKFIYWILTGFSFYLPFIIPSNFWFLGFLASVFSGNVVRFKSSIVNASLASNASLRRPRCRNTFRDVATFYGFLCRERLDFTICRYISAAICRFREAERRAISIEVGMQNSSLGVVLATTHFTSPVVALPPAMSAVIMNIMGSSLGFFWRQISGSKQELEDQG